MGKSTIARAHRWALSLSVDTLATVEITQQTTALLSISVNHSRNTSNLSVQLMAALSWVLEDHWPPEEPLEQEEGSL